MAAIDKFFSEIDSDEHGTAQEGQLSLAELKEPFRALVEKAAAYDKDKSKKKNQKETAMNREAASAFLETRRDKFNGLYE